MNMPTSHLLTNKQIAVIGGGPVGLTVARLLQLKGAMVTVYERNTSALARLLGGTLDIKCSTGQKALEKAGLLNAFYAAAKPVEERMLDTDGQVLLKTIPNEQTQYDQPEIDRPDLQHILLESLQENTVVWDRQVTNLMQTDKGFTLHFQDGSQATADLVIVADGSMSKARRLITEQMPMYTGTYAVQGEIYHPELSCPTIYKLINKGNMACVADKKSIFAHTKANGHINFYVTFRPAENWQLDHSIDFTNRASVNDFLIPLFASWSDLYKELFTASDEYTGLPLRVFLLDQPWPKHKQITLVGDAAHVMPPFGGEGANMGLRDALLLTDNLTSDAFTSIQAAIDDYEQQMFAYALPIQQGCLQADERIHTQSENAAERMKRMIAHQLQVSQ